MVAQLDQAAARGEKRRADTATAQARATRTLRLEWGQCEVTRAGFGRFGHGQRDARILLDMFKPYACPESTQRSAKRWALLERPISKAEEQQQQRWKKVLSAHCKQATALQALDAKIAAHCQAARERNAERRRTLELFAQEFKRRLPGCFAAASHSPDVVAAQQEAQFPEFPAYDATPVLSEVFRHIDGTTGLPPAPEPKEDQQQAEQRALSADEQALLADWLLLIVEGTSREIEVIKRAESRQPGTVVNTLPITPGPVLYWSPDDKTQGAPTLTRFEPGEAWPDGLRILQPCEQRRAVDGNSLEFPLRRVVVVDDLDGLKDAITDRPVAAMRQRGVPRVRADWHVSTATQLAELELHSASESVRPRFDIRAALHPESGAYEELDAFRFDLPQDQVDVVAPPKASAEDRFKSVWAGSTCEPGVGWACTAPPSPLTDEEKRFAEGFWGSREMTETAGPDAGAIAGGMSLAPHPSLLRGALAAHRDQCKTALSAPGAHFLAHGAKLAGQHVAAQSPLFKQPWRQEIDLTDDEIASEVVDRLLLDVVAIHGIVDDDICTEEYLAIEESRRRRGPERISASAQVRRRQLGARFRRQRATTRPGQNNQCDMPSAAFLRDKLPPEDEDELTIAELLHKVVRGVEKAAEEQLALCRIAEARLLRVPERRRGPELLRAFDARHARAERAGRAWFRPTRSCLAKLAPEKADAAVEARMAAIQASPAGKHYPTEQALRRAAERDAKDAPAHDEDGGAPEAQRCLRLQPAEEWATSTFSFGETLVAEDLRYPAPEFLAEQLPELSIEDERFVAAEVARLTERSEAGERAGRRGIFPRPETEAEAWPQPEPGVG